MTNRNSPPVKYNVFTLLSYQEKIETERGHDDIAGNLDLDTPYWYLDQADYRRPCGIYAGLEVSGERTAEQDCRAYQGKTGRSKK